jgi:putative nucleotidyltransferase with HDIG domain
MSSGSIKRFQLRTTRTGNFNLPPGRVERTIQILRRREVLIRVGMCIVASVIVWAATAGWAPPFTFRTGYIPPRPLTSRVDFEQLDLAGESARQIQARKGAPWYYRNDPEPLDLLRKQLKESLFKILRAESFDAVDKTTWREFYPDAQSADTGSDQRVEFERLRETFVDDVDLAKFDQSLDKVMADWRAKGLIKDIKHSADEGSHSSLRVFPIGAKPESAALVSVEEVRVENILPKVEERLREALSSGQTPSKDVTAASMLIGSWLRSRLPETLGPDRDTSIDEIGKLIRAGTPKMIHYSPGSVLVPQGKPIGETDRKILLDEYRAYVAKTTLGDKIAHSLANVGMYIAMLTLCGIHIYWRRPELLTNLRSFSIVLFSAVITAVAVEWIAHWDRVRVEIVPLLLFGMTIAIAYDEELALLLSAAISLIAAFSLEQGLPEFVILVAGVASSILFVGRIRSRTRLIYAGAVTGGIVLLTTMGVSTLSGQTFGASQLEDPNLGADGIVLGSPLWLYRLSVGAAWYGFCSLVAGVLMTGLLPFIERLFDVQTDISLLELGDAAHPLLQELVRRAPGTYNHSINVASIGEAAAEAIGANGLLVRVGAYFHDIGKMMKPMYFVENQGGLGNRHEGLQPAMSTLVIIAHVKDGIDLARQYGLPETIVDFVAQHHGTTLVEYFYRKAAKSSESDPAQGEVDESNFRYPGPKPQNKETAVLMLADCVESASRALVDPTPSRIESLVHDLAMKRLLDGQFDECGLTLQELSTIEESLVKSLTAVYHGRVKYPEHQTV